MGGRTRLSPDEQLDQRHSMRDLAPLGLGVLGMRHENRRDLPPRIAVQGGTRCLTATEAVTFEYRR
jgi:hypothetical protein